LSITKAASRQKRRKKEQRDLSTLSFQTADIYGANLFSFDGIKGERNLGVLAQNKCSATSNSGPHPLARTRGRRRVPPLVGTERTTFSSKYIINSFFKIMRSHVSH
jgi:hypothetical protein